MKDPRSEALNYVELTVEGNEDLTVRPWGGPSPRNADPAEEAAEDSPLENVHVLSSRFASFEADWERPGG
jgi:hypothetical protein